MTTKLKFSAPEVSQALDRLAGAIVEACGSTQNLMFVGVADGGVGVAHRLAEKVEESLGRKIPLGIVDVSFHRDDIGSNPIPKAVVPTNLPPEVEGSSCILVDDVIFSGRTIRAALNELFDQGRPASVELAVLVDRRFSPWYIRTAEEKASGCVVSMMINALTSAGWRKKRTYDLPTHADSLPRPRARKSTG